MPEVDLGDVRIHYEEAGQANPLAYVHCHGLGGSGDRFAQEFDFWAERFHAVAWDNRGLGNSSAAAKYNLPLYASDLARLLDHLRIERAVLHGVSWGGVLLQQFALDYPERCLALIFDSTSSECNVAASEAWYERGEAARRPGSDVPPEQVESRVAQSRAVAALREHPFTPRLRQIACPSLVVAGGADTVAGAGGSVIMSRAIPNARLAVFQDAGHGIYREKPAEFRALVLDFLSANGIAS
jgi:pimeloyl-ACP methyl ester carboxylesterase